MVRSKKRCQQEDGKKRVLTPMFGSPNFVLLDFFLSFCLTSFVIASLGTTLGTKPPGPSVFSFPPPFNHTTKKILGTALSGATGTKRRYKTHSPPSHASEVVTSGKKDDRYPNKIKRSKTIFYACLELCT
ncbi:unnamed protein product [Ixodes pacificus]